MLQPLRRIFGNGRKENVGKYMLAHQYKELEELLAREKSHVKQLSDSLSRAHGEIVSLKAQGKLIYRVSIKSGTILLKIVYFICT